MKKRTKACIGIFAALALALLLVREIPPQIRYRAALRLMRDGQYEAAREAFDGLDGYRHSEGLMYCCEAYVQAGKGNYRRASFDLYMLGHEARVPKSLYPRGFETLEEEIKAGYEVYLRESARLEREAYEEKVRTSLPFVGMSEADIDRTLLGPADHKDLRNYESIRGKQVPAYVYDWYRDGYVIFSARCYNYGVQQVWDDRANPWKRVGGNRVPASGGVKPEEDDPLDAKSYGNVEDFYDDNYDDFFDFEDAEDYYNEHVD